MAGALTAGRAAGLAKGTPLRCPVPGRALPLRGLPEAEAGLAGLETQASCAGEGGARDSPSPQARSFLVENRFLAMRFRGNGTDFPVALLPPLAFRLLPSPLSRTVYLQALQLTP